MLELKKKKTALNTYLAKFFTHQIKQAILGEDPDSGWKRQEANSAEQSGMAKEHPEMSSVEVAFKAWA